MLEDWLINNYESPYPTDEEKARLARLTGASLRQVVNTRAALVVAPSVTI